MSKRDEIKAAIDTLEDEQLDWVHQYIERCKTYRLKPGEKSIFEKLMEIKVQGPPDWSENLDRYMSGEKDFDANVR